MAKSKVMGVTIEMREGHGVEVTFYRYDWSPEQRAMGFTDWMQRHGGLTRASCRRVERIVRGGNVIIWPDSLAVAVERKHRRAEDAMALCRFSDRDCDLYIYESLFGIECYVAAARLGEGEERVAIGLPLDGTLRTFGGWDELLEFVVELRRLGYLVPEWVVEEIELEMADEERDE